MILNNKKITIDSIFLINLLFAFFPISFIIGNFATNANMFLLCILGIFHLRSKIFTAKLNFSIKIIFLLFCIVIFSTILSLIKSLYFGEYESYNFFKLLKSILFFRFFIMLLIIYLLNELNIINFKYFFITACFFTFLISLDVIYQYIFGFNIIGLESFYYHNSSFFGDELISGIYIQHFSFFSIFLLAYFLKKKNNFLKILLVTIGICILATGIIFSGNRMPFILFLLGLILIFLLNKKLRTTVLISFMSIFIIFGYINSFDSKISQIDGNPFLRRDITKNLKKQNHSI